MSEMRSYKEREKKEGRSGQRVVEEKTWCRLIGDKIVISIVGKYVKQIRCRIDGKRGEMGNEEREDGLEQQEIVPFK